MEEKQKNRRELFQQGLWNLLAVSAVAIFPAVFLYGRNAAEVSPWIALQGVGIFILEAMAVYGLYLLIMRSVVYSGLTASVTILLINNYTLLKKVADLLFPRLKYWHILFLLCLVIAHIAWAIARLCKKEIAQMVTNVLSLVMAGLCVLNLCMAIPGIASYIKLENAKKQNTLLSEGADAGLPNFYYIIFDEYGGYDAVEKYYGYDGNENISFFEDLGFQVSTTSYAGTGNTLIETANLFNLDYVIQNGSNTDAAQARWNPPFFQFMQEKGYAIHGVGAEAEAGYGLPTVFKVAASEAQTIDGQNFLSILLGNTAMYPLLNRQDPYLYYRREVSETLEFFKSGITFKDKGNLYFLHVNCPHMPFIFDKNGNSLDDDYAIVNWIDKEIYLGQYQYITEEMKQIAEVLVRNDPNGIIVFQSDHGFRGGNQLSDIPQECVYNILNNVYFQGKNLEVKGLSAINTLRTILNELFGMEYTMVIPPEGMYTK